VLKSLMRMRDNAAGLGALRANSGVGAQKAAGSDPADVTNEGPNS
jgi:hypothetical protein